ncbi:MAG: DUF3298 and DUF4163 domain-containing protein [Acidobacteria bacterium]|nr:DUF3298 and DUF4163 domain-containing protein [Acidobacteriota bacterium]
MNYPKSMRAVFLGLVFITGIFAQTQDGPDPEQLKLRVVSRHYDDINEKARWEISADYPDLRLKGDIGAAKFNALAKSLVMDGVLDFKKRMSELSAEEIGHLPEGAGFYFETGYSVEYLSESFVSINFSKGEFSGGAHPSNHSFTLNYDLKTDRVVKLSDLFLPGSGYLNVISKICIEKIKDEQGENASNEWIEDGAGPREENFEKWNVTEQGLKFTFDQYEVGPYAAGPFEILVPFEKLRSEMGQTELVKVIYQPSAVLEPEDDRFMCRNGLFTSYQGTFSIGRVKMAKGEKIGRAYFYEDSDTCPKGEDCRLKSYVISGDALIVAAEKDGFYCAWFQPKKGSETVGWIRKHELHISPADPQPDLSKWLGTWESNENDLNIARSSVSGGVTVKGNAFWKGLGDNIHIGEVDDAGSPNGNTLTIGGDDQYDCRVKMTLFENLLIVSDNRNCGGANVTFDGVYRKKR